jgi:peptidoglycan/xylan/chitin deacetylase (PgdA/CDA1 family)
MAPGRMARRRAGTAGLAVLGVAAGAHWVPSVVSLGQWSPLRSLPGRWCTWRGDRQAPVALTFDDGPSPASTPRLLDRLDELGLRATFFCVGHLVVRHPDLVAELVRRGHQVEAHGYEHRHHFVRSPVWVRRDLEASSAALRAVGVRPRWYRPPFGQVSGATLIEARRQGLRLVLWSAWGREWASPDSAAVAARIGSRLEPGAVVLLHDGDGFSPPGTADRVLGALGSVAEEIDRRGLAAATLDEVVDGCSATGSLPEAAVKGGKLRGNG